MKTRISLIEDVRAIPKLSTSERCMMYTLASYANPDGTNIYPSQDLLAKILGVSDRQVRNLLTALEEKGHLMPDGRRGYHKKYRLNIPEAITKVDLPTSISQEEWEAMMLPPAEEDDDATEMRMPVVKPPPAPPPETPVAGPSATKLSPEEALEGAAKLARKGIRSYEWYLKGGRKKGYTDEYLEWKFRGGGETGSLGSQPDREPESAITNISERTH
jgi:hypothetical protein